MARAKKKSSDKTAYVWAALRISIGLIFLWAFTDKLLGLGFATCRSVDPQSGVETVEILCEKSVSGGGSPTEGFLKFGTQGPFQDFYQGLAGNGFVDFLFMAGLGLIGASLVFGVGVKVAAISGILLLMMMWTAVLPGENNPLIDDHVVYSIALLGVMLANKNQVVGLGRWWQNQAIVKKYSFLE